MPFGEGIARSLALSLPLTLTYGCTQRGVSAPTKMHWGAGKLLILFAVVEVNAGHAAHTRPIKLCEIPRICSTECSKLYLLLQSLPQPAAATAAAVDGVVVAAAMKMQVVRWKHANVAAALLVVASC